MSLLQSQAEIDDMLTNDERRTRTESRTEEKSVMSLFIRFVMVLRKFLFVILPN